MGLNLWFLWVSECKHTTHTGSRWSTQKSVRFSLCSLQWNLPVLSSKYASQRFLRAKFCGGSPCKNVVLQIGHVTEVSVHHLWRHALQKLWLHHRITGSWKISRQIGHLRLASGWDSIFSLPQTSQSRFCSRVKLLKTGLKYIQYLQVNSSSSPKTKSSR